MTAGCDRALHTRLRRRGGRGWMTAGCRAPHTLGKEEEEWQGEDDCWLQGRTRLIQGF